jgi:hypothetical protein
VVMHGHRHVGWIGECGGTWIISAPSPVMSAGDHGPPRFYIHTLSAGADGQVPFGTPECNEIGQDIAGG